MDNVKFKLYHKAKKMWIKNFAIEFNGEEMKVYEVTEYEGYVPLGKDEVSLVQYTGIEWITKVKEGKPIRKDLYAGDIMFDVINEKYYEIVFEQSMFALNGFESGDGFYPNLECALDEPNGWQLVGNIYENSELLNN